MPRLSLTPKETEALRAALEQEDTSATPDEAIRNMQALSPHINSAALRLAQMLAERRAIRLQAWGLAGGMVLFVTAVWLVYQNWEYLLAEPMRWGLLVCFGAITFMVVGCLPVILRKEEGAN